MEKLTVTDLLDLGLSERYFFRPIRIDLNMARHLPFPWFSQSLDELSAPRIELPPRLDDPVKGPSKYLRKESSSKRSHSTLQLFFSRRISYLSMPTAYSRHAPEEIWMSLLVLEVVSNLWKLGKDRTYEKREFRRCGSTSWRLVDSGQFPISHPQSEDARISSSSFISAEMESVIRNLTCVLLHRCSNENHWTVYGTLGM